MEKLQQAIAALESQRATLGENIVKIALAPLKEKLAALSSKSESHRRIITVLFADVQNFTGLAEKMDMEDLQDTMSLVWERIDGLIVAGGGSVDKHMGDSVMAVWGKHAVHEDDPEKAVRTALNIQDCLKDWTNPGGLMPIVMRIGLHTGLAMVDTSGGPDATVLGDTVNLASRLEKNAPPGGVLISHDTYRQVRGLFSVEALSPLQIRGRSEPIQTYRVLDVKPLAFRMETRGVEGVETRLVGRFQEMQVLEDTFQKIVVSHGNRLITIVGEAGLGKSRMLYEFMNWAELQPVDIWLFQGRANASMIDSPYSFLRELFSMRFQIQDDESIAHAHAKFEHGLAEFMGSEPRLDEKAQYIGHLIGLDYSSSPDIQAALKDPRQFQRQAVYYLTQFFDAAARRAPTLLLLDDLHWVDGASLTALQSVLENLSSDVFLLTLCTTRPNLFERYDWPVGTRLDLHPLSKNDSFQLVSQILKYIPDPLASLKELVVERSEGNPFYLEELIKMLIDTGVILTDGEQWQVVSDRLKEIRIPATLVEVLQARLGDLQPAELSALQRASIIGRVFWDDAVTYLGGHEENGSLPGILATLERKELIYPRQPSAFFERREYRFKHAILHEVTYETVLKRQRAAYHARAAEWLEHAAGERSAQYIPQIADHYEKAGQTEQAAYTLLKAARRSDDLAAYAEACGFLERGLALASVLPENMKQAALVTEMRVVWCRVLSRMGAYPEAQKQAELALSLARQTHLDALAAEALSNMGFMFTDQGEYDRAETYLDEALPLAQSSSDQKTECFVLSSLAYVNARRANWPMAEHYYAASRDLAQKINDTERYLVALNGLGIVARYSGQVESARKYWTEIVEQGSKAGYRFMVLSALNGLGSLCDDTTDEAGAIRYYEQAIQIAMESGSRQRVALIAANIGEAYLKLNDLPAARQYLHTALETSWQLHAWPIVLGTVVFFARLTHAEGNLERALALLGAVQAHPSADGDAKYAINMLIQEWKLDEQTASAGLQAGASLDWDVLIRELMAVV